MADLLATADELASLMRDTGLDVDSATLLLELCTGEVQGMARQRLVEVVDDEFELYATTDSWLVLPERPVSEVGSLSIDGGDQLVAGTDYRWARGSARLFRRCGWASRASEPSIMSGVYTHGYPVGSQELQPARAAVLALARSAYPNKSGVKSEAIDDYRVEFAAAVTAAAEAAPHLAKSMRSVYGERAGLVRIG